MNEPVNELVEATIVEEAVAARLRTLDLVGLIMDKRLLQTVSAQVADILKDLTKEERIAPGWGVTVKAERDVLQVQFLPPPRYIKLDLVATVSKLPCGCHCKGGCCDPYAACARPCAEHTPL